MIPQTRLDLKETITETRRQQILQGAAQVFSEKGFHKATTKQIAQAAGVSEGTIYNYFQNKRELLFALLEMVSTQTLRSNVLDNPPADPQEFLRLLLRDRLQLLHTHGHLLAPVVAEVFTDASLRQELYDKVTKPLASLVEQHFQQHIESGQFRAVNPMIITRFLVGGLVFNMASKLSGLEPRYQEISEEMIIEEAVNLLLQGISTD